MPQHIMFHVEFFHLVHHVHLQAPKRAFPTPQKKTPLKMGQSCGCTSESGFSSGRPSFESGPRGASSSPSVTPFRSFDLVPKCGKKTPSHGCSTIIWKLPFIYPSSPLVGHDLKDGSTNGWKLLGHAGLVGHWLGMMDLRIGSGSGTDRDVGVKRYGEVFMWTSVWSMISSVLLILLMIFSESFGVISRTEPYLLEHFGWFGRSPIVLHCCGLHMKLGKIGIKFWDFTFFGSPKRKKNQSRGEHTFRDTVRKTWPGDGLGQRSFKTFQP